MTSEEGATNPGDFTTKRHAALLKAKAERDAARVNVAEVRANAYREGYDKGWIDGADYFLQKLRDAGVDVDRILSLDDEGE